MPHATEFRPYVALEFRATLPVPTIHTTTPVRVRDNDRQARNFFRQPKPGILHGKSVEAIIRRTYRYSAQGWTAVHPYRSAPTVEELHQLWARIHYSATQSKPTAGFDPAGMTPERAIQVAIQALGKAS